MIDPKLFDTDNEYNYTVEYGLKNRGMDTQLFNDAMVALYACKKFTTKLQEARSQKNDLSRQFGQRKKDGLPVDELSAEIAALAATIIDTEEKLRENTEAFEYAMARIPNIPDSNVPKGGEENNVVELTRLTPTKIAFPVRDHVDIGTKMRCLHFGDAAEISGTRFVVLTGALAKLERVLGQWMLDYAVDSGYEETSVPHLVRRDTMFGTGQLPKFEEDLFQTTDGRFLIPTAEVPLTNMLRNQVVSVDEYAMFSRSMCALTPCYRAEAGSAGRDTRGLMRMHQFNKVELVTVCLPSMAGGQFLKMVDTAHGVLSKLGLPNRRVRLAAGDLGFSAAQTVDLEVWIPSEKRYREIASISTCGDFQARRMNARFKYTGHKGTYYLHTMNGSGVAVGRALLAIMENYQTEQGGIAIPQVLRKAMGGSLIAPDGQIV